MAPHQGIRKQAPSGRGAQAAGAELAVAEIPDKLYFRIGEVARLCDVPAYVLRFWETEFPQLRPNKGGTGQRLFRRRDVEMALRVKRLLYEEGYTIPGARQLLKAEGRHKESTQLTLAVGPPLAAQTDLLRSLQGKLRDLLTLLEQPAADAMTRRLRSLIPDPELAARTIARRNKISAPRRSPLHAVPAAGNPGSTSTPSSPRLPDRLFDFPTAADPPSSSGTGPDQEPGKPVG